MLKENLKYHPNRFIYCRPFLKDIIKKYKNVDSDDELIEDYNARIDFYGSYPADKTSRELDNLIDNEEKLYSYYVEYLNNGQNIFHFPNALLNLFNKTDVDNVYLKYIHFPFKQFYIYLGLQKELLIFGKDYFVDGAYIRYEPEIEPYLKILLTTVQPNLEYNPELNIIENPDKSYEFDLLINEDATVGSSIENEFKIYKDADLDNVIEKKFIPGFPIFKESLRLIINALCYLSSEHKEVDSRYPSNTPDSLIDKLSKSKSTKDIQRNQSKLESQGYTKILFCGDSVKKEYESIPSGKELSTHWRRGHWRNQVYGESFLQHKLIWIKPTIVRKDKGESMHGHIYDI